MWNSSKTKFALFLVLIAAFPIWAQSSGWPNEPAGSALVADWGFSSLTGSGWSDIYPGSHATIVANQNGPASAPSALQMEYYKGMPAGIGPGNITYSIKNQLREIYVGFWWKVSNPWQSEDNSGVNKVLFLMTGTQPHVIFSMMGKTGGPYKLYSALDFSGISNSHLPSSYGENTGIRICTGNINPVSITLGQWHRIEFYLKHSTATSSKDGIVRWWVDGTLVGNYQNANLPAEPWSQLSVAPTWGGMNNTKTQTDYFWYDHMRISAPNCGAGGCPINIPLLISTAQLPSGQSGKAYSATLQALGGKAPYGWTIVSGSLHKGLTLNKTTGVISGTITSCGRADFTVKVMDSSVPAQEATKDMTIIASGTCTALIGQAQMSITGPRLSAKTNAVAVRFAMPWNGIHSLGVYDLSGREMWKHTGTGEAVWNHGGKLQKGIYVVRTEQKGKAMHTTFTCLQ